MIRTSPFTATAARPVAGIDPSEGQINYIATLVNVRDWAASPLVNHRARVATISAAISMVTEHGDDPKVAAIATAPFVGGKVNQVLHNGGVDQLTKAGASKLIDWLLLQPVKESKLSAGARRSIEAEKASRVEAPEVPAGRYAVATEDGATNELAFYKVDRPTEGRWAGYVFVKLMRSDEEVRLSRAAGNAILAKIAEVGAEEASKAYGREIGECGVCGRTLTNDDSRAMGIGPKCAEKF